MKQFSIEKVRADAEEIFGFTGEMAAKTAKIIARELEA